MMFYARNNVLYDNPNILTILQCWYIVGLKKKTNVDYNIVVYYVYLTIVII